MPKKEAERDGAHLIGSTAAGSTDAEPVAADSEENVAEYGESDAQYELLVKNIKDYAIFMLDPGGHVLTWNEGAQRIKGYKPEEIIGKHFSIFYPQEALARNWPAKELEYAIAEGRFEDESWRVRKDGTQFWANVIITALHDNTGRLVGFGKVTRDLTERRQWEEQTRELNEELKLSVDRLGALNSDLAQKNAENEMFVYSVSHDIRAPLVNLQGFSQEIKLALSDLRLMLKDERFPDELREKISETLNGGIAESVNYIQTAVKHLSNIIDGLLRLSRAGRVQYEWSEVPIQRVVGRIIDSLSVTIAARRARISVDALPVIAGDTPAIEQLFSNLISNALNYLDPAREGRIHIGTLPGQGDKVIFFVKDNGLGIPEPLQSGLFRGYQRFHPNVARGEGMGLAIVQRIIERHNGRIWIESKPGEGSTFYVALPNTRRVA